LQGACSAAAILYASGINTEKPAETPMRLWKGLFYLNLLQRKIRLSDEKDWIACRFPPSARRATADESLLRKELSSSGIAVRRTASLPLAYHRTIQYAVASRFYRWRLWNTGSPACAGDDA
jgi:hypothetical protein